MTVVVKKEWLKGYGHTGHQPRARSWINWPAISRYGWILAIAFVPVFFYIWQNVRIIRSGYEVEKLRITLTGLQAQNSLLTLEAASLEDLYIMERRASLELGMITPQPGQIVYARIPEPEESNEKSDKSVAESIE